MFFHFLQCKEVFLLSFSHFRSASDHHLNQHDHHNESRVHRVCVLSHSRAISLSNSPFANSSEVRLIGSCSRVNLKSIRQITSCFFTFPYFLHSPLSPLMRILIVWCSLVFLHYLFINLGKKRASWGKIISRATMAVIGMRKGSIPRKTVCRGSFETPAIT